MARKSPPWLGIQIDRADLSPAHALAFNLVPATCCQVGAALNTLRQEIEKDYKIKPEDGIALDLAIHRAIAQIKANATEPLRKALIHTCSKALKVRKKPNGAKAHSTRRTKKTGKNQLESKRTLQADPP